MCDSMEEEEERRVVIPARLKGEGEEELEDGVIDIGQLYDAQTGWGSTKFRIPDTEWLVKYGWISEEEKDEGPFFLREFLIFPPPYGENRR